MAERPKRRKHKDNPYVIDYVQEFDIYIVSFKDINGKLHKVEVSKEVYNAFNQFELDDLSELNEFDNHIEHSEIFENNLNSRAKEKPLSLEDEVINKLTLEELKLAINKLSDTKKKRIKMYYFDEMTLEQIAKREHTSHQAISKSLHEALAEIKKIIKI